ncbi:MAG: hypothetical protein HY851_04500 [candidate division Zixibacteria bacterium]|nr:hypothetical protein [candidate division Zixibacteria bacterium]
MKLGDNEYPVKINRFTGRVAILGRDGWRPLDEERESTTQETTPLDHAELEQLSGSAEVNGGFFSGTIHNGTAKVINDMIFEVTLVRDRNKEEMTRKLRNLLNDVTNPFKTSGQNQGATPNETLTAPAVAARSLEWKRHFRVQETIPPFASSQFKVRSAGEYTNTVYSTSWKIIQASGYRTSVNQLPPAGSTLSDDVIRKIDEAMQADGHEPLSPGSAASDKTIERTDETVK